MSAAFWAGGIYLGIGLVWAIFMALFAHGQGGAPSWLWLAGQWLGWPYWVWMVLGPAR